MNAQRDQVARGSAYLLAATVGSAGLGFLFWVAAARLFTPAQVGTATSLTNAITLIAYFSLCGLNSTLVRFPAPPERRHAQINRALLLVFAAGCVLGTGYLLGLPLYGARLLAVRQDPVQAVLVVLFCALSAVNLLTDAVFIGERLPQYNTLVDGVLQGLSKLGLPFLLTGLGAFGLVTAVGGGYAVAVLASLWFLRRRIGLRPALRGGGTRLREQLGFSAGSYLSSLLNLLPLLVLPLLVLQRLGTAAAAYYFVAFQVANLANAVSFAVCESMFAEISADESRFGPVLRRSVRLIALVQLPGAVLLAAGSGLLLRLFGGAYPARAQSLLVVLAVGTTAVALNTVGSFVLKLVRRMAPLIWSNVVYAVVTIGLAALWAGRGLVWFGCAWGLGNLASGLYAVLALYRTRLPGRRGPRHAAPARTARPSAPRTEATAMKVLVVNAYVRENAGDAALLAVCLRQVRAAFPQARVTVAGMEDRAVHPAFDGAANLGSIRRYVADAAIGTPRRILRKAVGFLVSLGLLLPPRVLAGPLAGLLRPLLPAEVRREVDAVASADLVVSMGGGYFNARPGLDGYQNVFYVVLPLLLALRRGVPVVLAPQSFGPFPAPAQRRLAAYVVRRAALVLAREDVSVDILAECGVRGTPVRRAVDSGFAFAPPPQGDWRARIGVDPHATLVGVTARQWLAPGRQEQYERALAATIDAVRATGAQVVLIPQVTTDYLGDDDRIVERRIAGYCATPPLRVDETVDYRDLKGLYAECAYVLGTRFHSVIFALTSGVPCIAIEYEHKTRGIMRDLGLESWVLPIADVSAASLGTLVERLRTGREEYLRTLAEKLPGYVARAEELPELLRAATARRPVGAGA
ncbi:polysaccharide pyruvyl transferase family protein [Kitasatospora sp. NBC_01302]|uniref:polysaccharide pyruvyl transferase family protein n=1 Tax=Kitasatospora sp. NBC_01302 TaxID=2903575 RepID=UPI002E134F07|nr:polysaccharide pyruvyl transferase family protein [Kitasatospora sp. NBC_01302]